MITIGLALGLNKKRVEHKLKVVVKAVMFTLVLSRVEPRCNFDDVVVWYTSRGSTLAERESASQQCAYQAGIIDVSASQSVCCLSLICSRHKQGRFDRHLFVMHCHAGLPVLYPGQVSHVCWC